MDATKALPKLGTVIAGGTYSGITTDAEGQPYALILLADKPAKPLAWRKAIAWAETLGDGARLPDSVEGALLFARLKGQFEPYWHWLSDQCSDHGGAWGQYPEEFEGHCRAVRRIPLAGFLEML